MSRLEVEKGSIQNTKYGFQTVFGVKERRLGRGNWECGMRKRRKVGRWGGGEKTRLRLSILDFGLKRF
jgi:hypothetical protein